MSVFLVCGLLTRAGPGTGELTSGDCCSLGGRPAFTVLFGVDVVCQTSRFQSPLAAGTLNKPEALREASVGSMPRRSQRKRKGERSSYQNSLPSKPAAGRIITATPVPRRHPSGSPTPPPPITALPRRYINTLRRGTGCRQQTSFHLHRVSTE